VNVASRDLRLRSLADGVPRLGPRTVHFDLVNACNARCVTCWDHSPLLKVARPASWKAQRFDADNFVPLLDEILRLGGLEGVILSGMGEPFLHPQIGQMVEAVKTRGLHLTIISNLVSGAARTFAPMADDLLIGIHAASLPTYQAFHPGFGSAEWDRLFATLDACVASGVRCKHVHVVCASNAHEVVDMIRLGARTSAAQVNFKLASLSEGTLQVALSSVQREQLVARDISLAEAEAGRLGIPHTLALLRDQLSAGGRATSPMARVGCWIGFDYARITVDGTVLYCCAPEVQVGQWRAVGDFTKLWRGPAWSDLRARLSRREFFASCAQCGKLNENVKLGRRFADWQRDRGP
jgi:MoaA/NifB/PqqE/SkfB family radical SAM enzyme